MAHKPNYGIDAPGVIRNLFVACAACLVLIRFVRGPGFFYSAASFGLPAALMLIYSLAGKFRHRDRILAKVPWVGTEMVLDVGAGQGLLLIGAAKSGGLAVISDYKLMAEYSAEFLACGMTVKMFPRDWAGTFPPLRIWWRANPPSSHGPPSIDTSDGACRNPGEMGLGKCRR